MASHKKLGYKKKLAIKNDSVNFNNRQCLQTRTLKVVANVIRIGANDVQTITVKAVVDAVAVVAEFNDVCSELFCSTNSAVLDRFDQQYQAYVHCSKQCCQLTSKTSKLP